jgi:hypothetical protein
MAALSTVADYLLSARTLLQDKVTPYRYSDDELVDALNIGVKEARRLRPDLFISNFSPLPSYSSSSTGDVVAFDDQYSSALLYYVVGHAQLRDEEDTTDSRALALLSAFKSQLGSL